MIVDDHPIVRKGLTELINGEPDMRCVARVTRPPAVLNGFASTGPMSRSSTCRWAWTAVFGSCKQLDASLPEVRVLVLSMHEETLHAERALAAGATRLHHEARGDAQPDHRDPVRGERQDLRQRADVRAHRGAGDGSEDHAGYEGAAFERLTDREREVLGSMGRGLGTREIARQLGLSMKTIETYQARLKEKLGLTNGHELIRAAVSWTQS